MAMGESDCELYYRRRSDELYDWMRHSLKTMNDRNGLFLDVLRAKVDRKLNRADREWRILADAVAEARRELDMNAEHGREVMIRAGRQIEQYVSGLRWGEGDEKNTLALLAAEQNRLAEIVRTRRNRLNSIFDSVQSVTAQVCHERAVIEQMRADTAAVSVASAESVASADRRRPTDDGSIVSLC